MPDRDNNNNPLNSTDKSNNLNDQERLIKKIQDLEQEYNELDDRVEGVVEAIHEVEEVEGDEEATTELVKDTKDRTELKESVWGDFELDKDSTLDTGDVRLDNELTLKRVIRLAKEDLKTLRVIKDEIDEDHDEYDVVEDIADDLKDLLHKGKVIQKE
jgi:hypothetical protein